jgi:hypothetical protein
MMSEGGLEQEIRLTLTLRLESAGKPDAEL